MHLVLLQTRPFERPGNFLILFLLSSFGHNIYMIMISGFRLLDKNWTPLRGNVSSMFSTLQFLSELAYSIELSRDVLMEPKAATIYTGKSCVSCSPKTSSS